MTSQPDLSQVAGPDSMAAPRPLSPRQSSNTGALPQPGQSSSAAAGVSSQNPVDGVVPTKKKRHRAGKKRRNRRQSFIAPSDTTATEMEQDQTQAQGQRPGLLSTARPSAAQTSFFRLKSAARSNTSLESEALLDHRDQQPIRNRRQSIQHSVHTPRGSMPFNYRGSAQRAPHSASQLPSSPNKSRSMRTYPTISDDEDDDDDIAATDRTPLLSNPFRDRPAAQRPGSSHAGYASRRKPSPSSVASSRRGKRAQRNAEVSNDEDADFDVNNPPSVPGSPKLGTLDDVMIAEQFSNGRSPAQHEAVIDIDRDDTSDFFPPPSPSTSRRGDSRRRTLGNPAENDVCYPGDVELSELGEEGFPPPDDPSRLRGIRRRRPRRWPDLDVLDEWSREEKEERHQEMVRAKKISEPVLVGGRLRPKTVWHREEDDAPYRYTYFNENFDGTIHSRTISELCQFGASFRDLFIPEAPVLSDESDLEDDLDDSSERPANVSMPESGRQSRLDTIQGDSKTRTNSESLTPAQSQSQTPKLTEGKHFGPRPTFWLDVLSPTETEMKVLSKAFGIHQLTTEDILMQEPREKVELFQHYYFVNYRSFEQDKDSEDYMEPVNMYVVVFREGVISVSLSSSHLLSPSPAKY